VPYFPAVRFLDSCGNHTVDWAGFLVQSPHSEAA
jgi:hypothetical protein